MSNDKLAQYISALSAEEREKYRHLIEDALERDKKNSATFIEAHARAEDYAESLKRLKEESLRLKTSLTLLVRKLSDVADASESCLKIFSKGPSWN